MLRRGRWSASAGEDGSATTVVTTVEVKQASVGTREVGWECNEGSGLESAHV